MIFREDIAIRPVDQKTDRNAIIFQWGKVGKNVVQNLPIIQSHINKLKMIGFAHISVKIIKVVEIIILICLF
jgi:hypothetical protein